MAEIDRPNSVVANGAVPPPKTNVVGYLHRLKGGGDWSISLPSQMDGAFSYQKLWPEKIEIVPLIAQEDSAAKGSDKDNVTGVECTVAPMKTSAGTDYYVHLRFGDRTITPHMFKEEWKADYEVAEWKWFFGMSPKPDILAYGPATTEGSDR